MNPNEMANLHSMSGLLTRPWSSNEYRNLLKKKATRFYYVENGFLVAQILGEEAEILNVVVHPDFRRLGKAKLLICKFEKAARDEGSVKCFLEVAESNNSAHELYLHLGYKLAGRRKNYYDLQDGSKVNAVILSKDFKLS